MPFLPWDEFHRRAQAMFAATPERTRVTVKERSGEGRVEVRVSNDADPELRFLVASAEDLPHLQTAMKWIFAAAADGSIEGARPATGPSRKTARRSVSPGPRASGAKRRARRRDAEAAGGGGGKP